MGAERAGDVVLLFFEAGALSLDGLGRWISEVSVAGVVAIALAAGLDGLPGGPLLGAGAAELTWVSVAGIVAGALAAEVSDLVGVFLLGMGAEVLVAGVVTVALPPECSDLAGASLLGKGAVELTRVSLAGVIDFALAAGLETLVGASLPGMGAAELTRVSDLRVGSFHDFSFVSLLYQYFLPLTSYCFHGWLAGVATAFAAGLLIGVAACGAAVAPDFGAGPFAAAGTSAVGSFHDFSLVSLLYQYFFPTLNCQKLDFGQSNGPLLTSRFNCIDFP